MNRFPSSFSWGVSTSAYQIEGAADVDGRGPSIWDTFSHGAGNIVDHSTGDVACDHYHRFEEDVEIMRRLGVDAYRFSLSWPRILPDGVGSVNEAGVSFYRRLCETLSEAGITPLVTLYHWDLPQALQDRGGWLEPASAGWFAEYATVAKEALGDLVQWWTTLNEPWCSAFLGHSAGEHAPGMTDPGSAFVAAHHLMLAHHAGMRAMRTTRPHPDDTLGIVLNLIPAWPADPSSDADMAAAASVDAVQNRLFLDAVLAGRTPPEIRAHHHRFGVADLIDPGELATAHEPVDLLGVNYYNVNRFRADPGGPAPAGWPGAEGVSSVSPDAWVDEMGWAPEPEGLSWMLRRVAAGYDPLPIYICENGTALADVPGPDGVVDDQRRIDYLRRHIDALADAMEAGVDVRGYMVWSLLDNFEWARGYSKTFGLFRVDPDTGDRIPKASAHWYTSFLTHGG
jgi:beta-glucosidase